MIQFLFSLLIKIFFDLPISLSGLFIVPLLLLFKMDMSKTWWGNKDHPDNGGTFWKNKCGTSFWCAYQWFALRNPAFNWGKYILGVVHTGTYFHNGDAGIGDTRKGGSYWCMMGEYWEYYYIKPYTLFRTKRCIRVRFGWKIYGKSKGEICQFCFVVNPLMTYTGI